MGDKEKKEKGGRGKKRVGNYVFGGTIGTGAYGTVKLAHHTLTGEKVAVKIFKKGTELLDVERFHREIHALKALDHPNIVRLLEILETSSRIYLVMEYVSGMELFDYIVEKETLSEAEACYIFTQLLKGISFCHDHNVVHRDLKPENIIITKSMTVKIVDFGFANMVTTGSPMMATPCGSPYYAAPEVLSGKEYAGLGVDVWSLGVILYVCVAGYLPFDDDNVAVLFNYIKAGDYEIPDAVSPDFIDIVSRMLVVDTKRRSNVRNLLRHPWVTDTLRGITLPVNLDIEDRDLTAPIQEILARMPEFGYTPAQVAEHLARNSRNAMTAAYYLLYEARLRKDPRYSDEPPDFDSRVNTQNLRGLPRHREDSDPGAQSRPSSRRTHRSLASTRSPREIHSRMGNRRNQNGSGNNQSGTGTGSNGNNAGNNNASGNGRRGAGADGSDEGWGSNPDEDDPELEDARPVSPVGVPPARTMSGEDGDQVDYPRKGESYSINEANNSGRSGGGGGGGGGGERAGKGEFDADREKGRERERQQQQQQQQQRRTTTDAAVRATRASPGPSDQGVRPPSARGRARTDVSVRGGGGGVGGSSGGSLVSNASGANFNGGAGGFQGVARSGARPASSRGGRATPERGVPPPGGGSGGSADLRAILSAPEKTAPFLPPLGPGNEATWNDAEETGPSNANRKEVPVGMARNPAHARGELAQQQHNNNGSSNNQQQGAGNGAAGSPLHHQSYNHRGTPSPTGFTGPSAAGGPSTSRPGSAHRKSFADPESLRRGAAQIINTAASQVSSPAGLSNGGSVSSPGSSSAFHGGGGGGGGGIGGGGMSSGSLIGDGSLSLSDGKRRPSLTGLKPLHTDDRSRAGSIGRNSPGPQSPGGDVLSMLSAVGPDDHWVRGGIREGKSLTSPLPPT